MKYTNATKILPAELVEELQKYLQGEYLYIPSQQNSRRKWGEQSGARDLLRQRNDSLREAFRRGDTVDQLAERYYLSIHAVRKIIYSKSK